MNTQLQQRLNLTAVEDVQDLIKLQRYSEIFLQFSYYSGFVIAGFNFFIFILASILYSQVSLRPQSNNCRAFDPTNIFQKTSRRTSLMFIANLALSDTILPLGTPSPSYEICYPICRDKPGNTSTEVSSSVC